MKLLVILFLIKLYARKNILNVWFRHENVLLMLNMNQLNSNEEHTIKGWNIAIL